MVAPKSRVVHPPPPPERPQVFCADGVTPWPRQCKPPPGQPFPLKDQQLLPDAFKRRYRCKINEKKNMNQGIEEHVMQILTPDGEILGENPGDPLVCDGFCGEYEQWIETTHLPKRTPKGKTEETRTIGPKKTGTYRHVGHYCYILDGGYEVRNGRIICDLIDPIDPAHPD